MKASRIFVALLFVFSTISFANADGPFVAFPDVRHPSTLRGLTTLASGNWIAAIGADKAIRIVDTDDFSLIACHRFQQGNGRRGALRCIGAAPDGSHYAVGTYGNEGAWPASIYYVSVTPKKIVHRLEGHTDSINDVLFSPSGKLLASSSDDKTVVVWDVVSGKIKTRVRLGDRATVLAFASEEVLFVASRNGQIHRLSTTTEKAKSSFQAHAGRITDLHVVDDRVVSCGNDGKINIANFDGKRVGGKAFKKSDSVGSIEIADDLLFYSLGAEQSGAALIAGTHTNQCGVLRYPTMEEVRLFEGNPAPIAQMEYCADREEFIGCDMRGNILRYTVKEGTLAGKETALTQPKWRARFMKNELAVEWGNEKVGEDSKKIVLDDSFHLQKLATGAGTGFDPVIENKSFKGVELKLPPVAFRKEAWAASHAGSPDETSPVLLARVQDGRVVFFWLEPFSKFGNAKFFLPSANNHAIVGTDQGCYVFQLDPNTASIGHKGQLFGKAKLIKTMHEQQGTVNRMSWSVDKKHFLTSSSDGAIRIWNRNDFSLLMSVFVAGNEWIAWTRNGYYACSAGGERMIGWHVNNGMDKFADFQAAEQFSEKYYQPKVIRRLLDAGSEKAALSSLGIRQEAVATNLAPHVELVVDGGKLAEDGVIYTRSSKIKVRVSAKAAGWSDLKEIQILEDRGTGNTVNLDRPTKDFEREFTIDLDPGSVRISARAFASNGTHAPSNSQQVFYKSNELDKGRRKLHLLAIANDSYNHPGDFPNLRSIPSENAKKIKKVFESHAVDLFTEGVSARVVNPEDRGDVFDALAEIRKDFKKTDILVVYWGGHGEKDDDKFYFVLPKCQKSTLRQHGLSGEDFAAELATLPGGAVMLLIDTCYSGGFVEDLQRSLNDVVRSNGRAGYEVMTIAASSADTTAQDSLFGAVLQDGLNGTKDTTITDGDQRKIVVTQHLKAFLTSEIPRRSKSAQQPVVAGFENGMSYQLTIAAEE